MSSEEEKTQVLPETRPPQDSEATIATNEGGAEAPKKKKKKKNNRRRKPLFKNGQTNGLARPVDELYPTFEFPEGEFQPYTEEYLQSTKHTDLEEAEEARLAGLPGLDDNAVSDFRKAAEVHREISKYAKAHLKPGTGLWDFCNNIEEKGLEIIGGDRYPDVGQAFPLGVSLNEVAAHYTPNSPGENAVYNQGDILKFDIGYHVNGHIVDAAFTVCHDPSLDSLVEASYEATMQAIKASGPEMRLQEVGNIIEEVITSYEYTDSRGRTLPIQPIRNLSGHGLGKYIIHSGKSIPNCANARTNDRIEEGEVYALETFASTGRGMIHDVENCSHYMMDKSCVKEDISLQIKNKNARALYNHIRANFGTLAFSPRHLMRHGFKDWHLPLNLLVQLGVVKDYPPLADKVGCKTSQHEHTMIFKRRGKEVVTL